MRPFWPREPTGWWVTHLVAEGKAVVGLDSVGEIPVTSGDIVIFPHGHPHTISNGAPRMLVDSTKAIEGFLAGDLSTFRTGGGGEETRFVCGYFGCERHAARLFLSGLPSVITINVRHDAAGRWLESSIRHLLCEAASVRPGRAVLLAKMAEALFIETLRRFMGEMPPGQSGWRPPPAIPRSARRSRGSTASRVTRGRWPNWPPRAARRAPSLPKGSRASSATRRAIPAPLAPAARREEAADVP